MVFSSPIFLFYFLPTVLVLYFLAKGKIQLQNVILFFSSLLFYFWGEKAYTTIILFSILVNYITTICLEYFTNHRKWVLVIGIIINLSLLVYFKYINFIVLSILPSFGLQIQAYQTVHLPLGISFFTFHAITYIVDVYRREANRCSSLLNTGLYFIFFPQLIAGPIVKFADIEKQLISRIISNDKIYSGIKRFIIGLAKKIILANSLGLIADHIFALPFADLNTSLIWFGAFVFAYQIYYDFSGYSDMAIGLASIMGFEFKENFNFPFIARSFTDLWQRWHISLTSFFKYYLYIPLGGNRKGAFRTNLNILIVFTLIGLWHGASWNCLLWGIFIGCCLVFEKIFLGKYLAKLPFFFSNLYSMILFAMAIIIFKIEDIQILPEIFMKAFGLDHSHTGVYSISYYLSKETIFLFLACFIFAYPIHQIKYFSLFSKLSKKSIWLSDLAYMILFILTISMMAASTYNPFLYFKF